MPLPPPSETIALDDAEGDSDREAADDDEEDELDGEAGAAGEGEELEEGTDDDSALLLDSDDEDEDDTEKPNAGGRPDEGGGDPVRLETVTCAAACRHAEHTPSFPRRRCPRSALLQSSGCDIDSAAALSKQPAGYLLLTHSSC